MVVVVRGVEVSCCDDDDDDHEERPRPASPSAARPEHGAEKKVPGSTFSYGLLHKMLN